LKKVQGVLVEQRQAAEQENISLQANFDGEKAQILQGKEQLLMKQLEVKEAVSRELRSMTFVEIKVEDRVTQQVEKHTESIQQLQQCITDLELRIVPETPHDVRDQREVTTRSAVERIKSLAMECKKLTDRSAQTYKKLTENKELKALESQL
jgi:hypothetical protein